MQTVDFFTPIVDDPYAFGRIAATNALSDVYAMGGRPVTALNLVAFSLEELGADVLREILRGGADAVAARRARPSWAGTRSTTPSPSTGWRSPGPSTRDALLTNAGGRAGDALVLTKPVGAGAMTTALKRGLAGEAVEAAIAVMATLNREAAAQARAAGAHAVTDVTGFGLLGHLHELAAASGVAAEVDAAAIPAIADALALLEDAGAVSGGSRRNRAEAEGFATRADCRGTQRRLVCDAMTSGGLLVAVAPARAGRDRGRVVGRLVAGVAGTIRRDVRPPGWRVRAHPATARKVPHLPRAAARRLPLAQLGQPEAQERSR